MKVRHRVPLSSVGSDGPATSPTRRSLLLAAPSALLLSACGPPPKQPSTNELKPGALVRSAYGSDPSQFGYLGLPRTADPVATVVLLHGGAWESSLDYRQMTRMGKALVERGFAVWVPEYRRVGTGGGWPETFEDVARAVDHLSTLSRRHPSQDDAILTRRVALVGHSAGGQLAVWAASRRQDMPGGRATFAIQGAVSLAGVLDLSAAATFPLLGKPVRDLMGGPPSSVQERYRAGDPSLVVPAHVPVWAVHAVYDARVPESQAVHYVTANRNAGGRAELMRVPGNHTTIIDPEEPSWPSVLQCVVKASRAPGTPPTR